MYPAQPNSPTTKLSQSISDTQTTIDVSDASSLPPAPNLAVIGQGESAETILYESKNGNTLENVTRGFQGTSKAWSAGTSIARYFTAYDHDTFINNITENSNKITLIEDDVQQNTADIESIILNKGLPNGFAPLDENAKIPLQHLHSIGEGGADIDDETISTDLTWSSQKISTELSNKADISHTHTPSEVGLGNVDNVQQATKTEFNAHNNDNTRHITAQERAEWNSKADIDHTHSDATTSQAGFMSAQDKTKLNGLPRIFSGTDEPDTSLGSNGDVYFRYD